MKYTRFEDLPVWQKAVELARAVYDMARAPAFRAHPGLRDQLERAALSVSNNIAEGFERGTTSELLAFLYIARGSSGEVRSMLCVMEGMDDFHALHPQLAALKLTAESCSRQIRGWSDNLQNSEIQRQRHLTDRSRQVFQQRKRRDEFMQELDRIRAETESARATGTAKTI